MTKEASGSIPKERCSVTDRSNAIAWEDSGDDFFELEPQGNEVLLTVSIAARPTVQLCSASEPDGTCALRSWSPARQQRADAILRRLESPAEGI